MSATEPVSAEGGSDARDGASLFSPKVLLVLLCVGVFGFCAFLALSAYAPDLKSGSDGGEHALSRSAVGYGALSELLRARGDTVLVSRGPIRAGADTPGVLILTPGQATDPEVVAQIKFDGPILVVLPKWFVGPDRSRRGWVRKMGPTPPPLVTAPLTKLPAPPEPSTQTVEADAPAPTRTAPPELPVVMQRPGVSRAVLHGAQALFDPKTQIQLGPVENLQTLAGRGWTPALVDDQGRAVLARRDGTNLYVLSDPDLLNTQGLKELVAARAALAIVDGMRAGEDTGPATGLGPVIFDVTLHGFKRSRSLLKLAFEPPFAGLSLCLLAVVGLMGWHAASRFGSTPAAGRAFALGKRALADNSAALIKLTRREHRMGAGYAALERSAVARLLGAPRDLPPEALDALLDRIAEGQGVNGRITELSAEAAAAVDTDTLMQAASKLHRWRLEMTRERH